MIKKLNRPRVLLLFSLPLAFLVVWLLHYNRAELEGHFEIFWPSDTFESSGWKDARPFDRYRFYRDLRSRDILSHKTREEVVGMLGLPNSESPDGKLLSYVIKDQSNVSLTFDSVVIMRIRLDSANKVKSVYVDKD